MRARPTDGSRGRRPRLFWILLLALVVAGVEVGSYALLWIVEMRKDGSERDAGDAVMANRTAHLGPEKLALHPFLGFVLDPAGHPQARKPDRHPEAIEHGFPYNARPLFYAPSDERLVIGVFGGSVASILANNIPASELQRLTGSARYAGRRVEIVNVAMGGYKQPQQLMTLAYFLFLGAHFDVVINLDGFNDVALAPAENVPKKVFPYFPRSWYFLAEGLDAETRRRLGEVAYLRTRLDERRAASERAPWRYSATATVAWKLAIRRLAARLTRAQHALLTAEAGGADAYQVTGPERAYATRDEMMADLALAWRRGSLLMHELCSALGIEYYHFLQPNQYDPGSKPLSEEERRLYVRDDHPYRPGAVDGYPLLREEGAALRRAGVAFHDLSRLFEEVEETLYEDDCCHMNLKGNHLMARRITDVLTAR